MKKKDISHRRQQLYLELTRWEASLLRADRVLQLFPCDRARAAVAFVKQEIGRCHRELMRLSTKQSRWNAQGLAGKQRMWG